MSLNSDISQQSIDYVNKACFYKSFTFVLSPVHDKDRGGNGLSPLRVVEDRSTTEILPSAG